MPSTVGIYTEKWNSIKSHLLFPSEFFKYIYIFTLVSKHLADDFTRVCSRWSLYKIVSTARFVEIVGSFARYARRSMRVVLCTCIEIAVAEQHRKRRSSAHAWRVSVLWKPRSKTTRIAFACRNSIRTCFKKIHIYIYICIMNDPL